MRLGQVKPAARGPKLNLGHLPDPVMTSIARKIIPKVQTYSETFARLPLLTSVPRIGYFDRQCAFVPQWRTDGEQQRVIPGMTYTLVRF